MGFRFAAFLGCALLALVEARGESAFESVDMLFRNWTTRDGLPHNRVREVTRTRDGFIWLATDGGAVRFDGTNFKIYGLREGLAAPVVLALRETDDGALWIGTVGGGLSMLRNGEITRTYTTADGLPSNWVSGIGQDIQGGLVVSTLNGLAHFDHDRFSPLSPKGAGSFPPVLFIHRDGDGVVWGLASNRYLHRWEDAHWQLDQGGGPSVTSALCMDQQARMWVFGDGLLWMHAAGGWTSFEPPDGFKGAASSMACAPDGTIWISYHRSGLCGFKDGRFVVPAASPDYIPDLVETVTGTNDGQIWLTSSNGLYRMTRKHIQVASVDDPRFSRVANNLGGLVEAGPGEFVLATQGSGFYRWKDGHAMRLNDDPELGVGVYGNILLKTRKGSIWLGSDKALFEMKPDGTIRTQPFPAAKNVPVWALEETGDGLWVGSGHGELFQLKDGVLELIDYGGGREPIKAIVQEMDGTLWVGTRGNGLFQRKQGQWKRFGLENGLVSDVIRTLYLDPGGRLWVGTDGGGISLRVNGQFVSAGMKEGLPSESVSQMIFDDDGRLWIGTHRGLAVVDQDALKQLEAGHAGDFHPQLINRADGLPADEFTIVPPLKTSDGSYAFATVNGFIRLRPDDFHPDNTCPDVSIEKLTANGNPVSIANGTVSLPPGTERLEFEFTGLLFSDPERLKFRNSLTEGEPEWVYTGSRRFTEYRNLEPGRYHFKVEASSGNERWSPMPATVDVIIAPHYWQTGWFKVAVIILSFGLVAMTGHQVERRRSVRRMEVMKQRQAVDRERARISMDLHDDVGANLTQIALQSQLVERNLIRQPERAGKYLQEIFKTAREVTRALDDIIWTSNPSQDTLENFISFLGSFTQDYAEGVGLRSRFDVPESIPDVVMPSTVRHHLYLAVKEVLHNVAKHAEASEITLQVKLGGGSCVIVIRDNGRGIEERPGAAGEDGLVNLQARLKQLRGSCHRESVVGQGTSVELKVPMPWRNR